ncbi:hypothetical protein H5392_13920 [Tessaracoccus sp. MC1865]|uniref:hypothetical protein n=1 Tax=Tessaracoccus sp. MC1865 TaxID=2760310 RepID=UPI0016048CC2|nr:hypothetical protein [Tessaracoccus sp. MC1865]MBB1484955.1 hypothetical protein [Tessaracoccus sp. MC1865]QTO38614.1 hypothetical protein J7D54_05930 [Tessaracoccus sp. MC1865]
MSEGATPRSAAPAEVRRVELVGEVMAGLESLDDLPFEEQTAKLTEAQSVLQAVLNNDPNLTQLGIPGVAR